MHFSAGMGDSAPAGSLSVFILRVAAIRCAVVTAEVAAFFLTYMVCGVLQQCIIVPYACIRVLLSLRFVVLEITKLTEFPKH